MKQYFKLVLVISLFLCSINSSYTKNYDSSEVLKISPEISQKLPKERPSERIYTETETLVRYFIMGYSDIVATSQIIRELGIEYEDLNGFIEEFKITPIYKEIILNLTRLGYNYQEAEIILKATTSIALIYNEYSDKGIFMEGQLENIITKDKRLKEHLKTIIEIVETMNVR